MKLHKSIKVLCFQLKQVFSSPRIPLISILIAIFIFATVQPVSDFAKAVGILATPWVFPHIVNDFICQLVIMSAAVLLFCDAPFKSEAHIYILPRTGNNAWSIGMCLYIIVISFLFVFLILVAGNVALLPSMQLGEGWGKVWGTLARTSAGSQFGLPFSVNDYIIGAYSPMRATITTFLLEWACCVWLGLITYFLNNITDSMTGSLVAAAFVFLDITIANEWNYLFYRISPVTMAQIHTLSSSKSLYGLTMPYAVSFFVISIIVLVTMCILTPFVKNQLSILYRRKAGQYE